MSTVESRSMSTGTTDGVPLLISERSWRGFNLFTSSASTSVATWCFIIGGFVSYYLGAVPGTLVMIAGMLIGVFFIILALIPPASKYGIDSSLSSKPFLGTRGWLVSLVLLYVTVAGWNALLLIVLGRASTAVLVSAGVLSGDGAHGTVTMISMLLGAGLVWLIVRRGPDSVRDFSKWIAIGVLVLAFVVMGLLVSKFGLNGILEAKPSAPMDSKILNMTTGLEILIASAVAWWPYIGSMVRLVPSARTALWPSIMGLGIPVAAVSLIGLYAGLVIPESGGDPTVFLTQVGGLTFGIIALAFIVLANIGSIMIGVFAGSVALRQVPAVSRRISWPVTTGVALAPVILVVALVADPFFAHFPSFLAICALLFGPMCGVQIVDYFLLRKQRLSIEALYTTSVGNPYNFWAGFNPAGFVAIGAGVAAYLALLNPFTYESSGFYAYTTASIPSVIVAGGVYWLASQFVLHRGRGGYRAGAARVSPDPTPPGGVRS